MSNPQNSSRTAPAAKIWAAMLALYLMWGSTYLAMRFAIESLPPFLMAGLRFLFAGVLLFTWRRLAGDKLPTPRQWGYSAIIGLFLLLGGNGGVVWAEQRIPSGIAALLVGCTPLWMVLIEAIWHRRRPSWQVMAGILLGLGGIFALVGPAAPAAGGSSGAIDPIGALAVTLAALSWSAGSIVSREVQLAAGRQASSEPPLPASPLVSTGAQMLCGGTALVLLGSLNGEWARLNLAAVTQRSWFGLAYLIVAGSLIGFSAYVWLLKSAPISLVSTYAYVNPLVAVFLGALLASEPLTPRVLLAAGIIVAAVVLITRRKG